MKDALKAILAPLWTFAKIFGFAFAVGIMLLKADIRDPWVAFPLLCGMAWMVLGFEKLKLLSEEKRATQNYENCVEALNMCHMLGGRTLAEKAQKHADERLTDLARRVKWAHENLITLQRGGLAALGKRGVALPPCNPEDERKLEEARRLVRMTLLEEFAQLEKDFYRVYDRFLGVMKDYAQFRLRARDWNAYSKEDETVEKTA